MSCCCKLLPDILLAFRCRLIEFSQGTYGPLASNERFFYVLDTLLIFLILVISTFFHFGLNLIEYPKEPKTGQINDTPATELV